MNAETYKAVGFVEPEGTDEPYRCEKILLGGCPRIWVANQPALEQDSLARRLGILA